MRRLCVDATLWTSTARSMSGGPALGAAAAPRMPVQLPPPAFAHPGVFNFSASASFGASLEAMMAVFMGDGGGGGGGVGGGVGSLSGGALTDAAFLQQQMLAGSLPYGAATGGSAAPSAASRGGSGV